MSERAGVVDWKIVLTTAALISGNIALFVVVVFYVLHLYQVNNDGEENYLVPQDIWAPLLAFSALQSLINGVGLSLWRRSRSIGLGILAALLIAAIASATLVITVLAPAVAD